MRLTWPRMCVIASPTLLSFLVEAWRTKIQYNRRPGVPAYWATGRQTETAKHCGFVWLPASCAKHLGPLNSGFLRLSPATGVPTFRLVTSAFLIVEHTASCARRHGHWLAHHSELVSSAFHHIVPSSPLRGDPRKKERNAWYGPGRARDPSANLIDLGKPGP